MSNPVKELSAVFSTTDQKIYKIFAQCFICFQWTPIEGSLEDYGKFTSKARCQDCDGALDPRSAISERTFNPETAKRRRPLVKKKGNDIMLA